MANSDFKTFDEYMSIYPKPTQAILKTVRETIKSAVPEVEEVISYQIPAFKFKGWLLYVSAYKSHFSISCPPPFEILEKFKKDLEGYQVSKSTIQFPLNKPVPVALIEKMAKFQAEENLKKEK